jgi:sigma-B regulation protein RsbU (phosphoserine phosphatase)
LQPEDLLVLYTDGVTEATAPNDELFGTDRLVKAIEQWRDASPRAVIQGIRQTVEAFTVDRPLSDDTTLVVCRIA